MFASRVRRWLPLLLFVAGAAFSLGWFRRRALARNTQEFHSRYG